MRSRYTLPLLAVVLVTLSACKGATEVCDPTDPLCNDGSTPSISIGDVTVTEGSGGTVAAVFGVTLSEAASGTVTVQYATAAGTAEAPDDYASASGTLTFSAGATSQTVTVDVVSDIVGESDESFTVTLSSPTGATISDGTATGNVTDDDDCFPNAVLSPGEGFFEMLETTDCTWTSATDYVDMWLVTVPDTMAIAVDMTSSAGDFDPFVAIFSLDGSEDVQDNDGGYDVNARLVVILVPGTYVVFAAAGTATGETGSYEILVTEVPLGTVYGSTAGGGGANPSSLYTIDITTGAATLVGAIGFNQVGAMAFHPTTDVLYAVGARSGDGVEVLLTINPSTGVGTEVGPTGAANLGTAAGMSFRSDGTLFVYHSSHDVYTVDLSTGAYTLVGNSGTGGNGGNGVAFDASGVLHHSNRDHSNTIDLSTGTATYVADMLFPTPCGDTGSARISGVDRPAGLAQMYGVVKCEGGGSASHLGLVDFASGFVLIIGQTQDYMDGFAILD
jgi:hypothetical protein